MSKRQIKQKFYDMQHYNGVDFVSDTMKAINQIDGEIISISIERYVRVVIDVFYYESEETPNDR